MKTIEELQVEGRVVLQDYPTATGCWATTDGQFFLKREDGSVHAKNLGEGHSLVWIDKVAVEVQKEVVLAADKVSLNDNDPVKGESEKSTTNSKTK